MNYKAVLIRTLIMAVMIGGFYLLTSSVFFALLMTIIAWDIVGAGDIKDNKNK